ncbi:MAG: ABC transporter ATP-binding protein [Rhodospirillales bacterium]|jgi:peptide/nickel transport system ATP-binding protein|nr:ABC transporter ATP-binding protein [Rhodospirillales bacterium]MBT4039800.1 ABC transporter ATP-binding protein [Rhodospirillales bacterium]MBT4627470.1 ABC transporter ATP-binding protein [Rhodospirillales bacterium]MBT5350805.1 ABC transporter ATP-binding protein [Rhodospirillales bacterium]MBT6825960.1 ABC transporter ATP-binding protein [Rhodospirillales bacterium]
MSEPLLVIKDLVIEGYQEEQWNGIVHGVSLSLNRGEVLGIIGESGAGKSTIGIASMGYARPGCRIVSGSINFDGVDMAMASEDRLREMRGVRVAYVAQSAAASFNPAHRIVQQFTETPVVHKVMGFGAAEQKSKDLFKSMDLPDPENIGRRFPHQVSGGQLQRAMVAMAMSCDPDLIIFDEPTTALDVTTQIEVLAAIKDAIREHNTAALYITHDLAVVSQIADRIMVLRYGNEVETGETRQMIENPKEDYTRELLSVRKVHQDKADIEGLGNDILTVKNITASYGNGVRVLEDVSMAVTKGTTVAVVGESGSGKSTTARVITGLLPPEMGEILFHGEPLAPSFKDRPQDQLRRIQMIYQMADVALNPRQKVKDVIGRPLELYFGLKGDAKKARVKELLEKIELGENYMDRFPSELSGGEKQRVCIARALAAEPELIICDEVTSALDQLVAKGILKLLQDLQNDLGVSYLFITHDLATVKAISDEIVVMYQGKVVEQGPRDEILTPPHHDYTDLLLSSVPEMDPDWLDGVLEHRKELEARGVVNLRT